MSRAIRLAAVAAAILLLAPDGASAQATANQACYVPSSGTVYLVGLTGTPSSCRTGHTPVILQGPTGPEGPEGPAGPAGPPGTPGVSGYEIIKEDLIPEEGIGGTQVTLQCPEGKKAVGGGSSIIYASLIQSASHPYDADGRTWRVGIAKIGVLPPGQIQWATAYAVCVTAQ